MASTTLAVDPQQLPELPSLIDGLPNISGWEAEVQSVVQSNDPVALPHTNIRLRQFSSAFAIALHMHQPTIPAGADDSLISNLQYMFEHPYDGDNHNAGPFSYCYSRMADFIPDLVSQGCNPRVMLDYSGNLLWGLEQMGRHDILDNLRRITSDEAYYPYVEWLGTMWSHAVVPSTPIRDFKHHVVAWQHHFASVFGWNALARVKGFSLPEMHLPNHPDTLYEFIRVLKEAGYRWLLAQEHTIERLSGEAIAQPHVPHQLVAHNSRGETVTMTVLIKTQGSDTKLVGQMQPYYEAKTVAQQARPTLAGKEIPPLVTQISDGENGGVMMNEFPGMFRNAWYEIREQGLMSGVMGVNGTEYLELLEAEGISANDYPKCQAKGQSLIWNRIDPDTITPEGLEEAIAALKVDNPQFAMDGGSWTNHISWEKGYENVTSPMHSLSYQFHNVIGKFASNLGTLSQEHRYRNALLHNLLLQTSCFRYWGQGTWTDYAQELYRRGEAILRYDF